MSASVAARTRSTTLAAMEVIRANSVPHGPSLRAASESPAARDFVIASNFAFLPAATALFLTGWVGVSVHTVFVMAMSYMYHTTRESRVFALVDQFSATLLFFIVVGFAHRLDNWAVIACASVGLVFWKLGHKCHCKDKATCGHPYTSFEATCHGVMHLLAAAGAASLAMSPVSDMLHPFDSLFFWSD
jgi:hypothetical protein